MSDRGFELNDSTVERSMTELSESCARNVGAVADLFTRWREPEVARKVIESIIAGDGAAFRDLGDLDLPIPPLNICIWLFELVEKVAPSDTVDVCRLRTDLSRDEFARYVAIVWEFRRRGQLPPIAATSTTDLRGPVIPPGPFLTALQAEKLVICEKEPVNGGLALAPARPTHVCA